MVNERQREVTLVCHYKSTVQMVDEVLGQKILSSVASSIRDTSLHFMARKQLRFAESTEA